MITEKQYKNLILSAGCIITGETGPRVVPHHVKCFANGAGKVSDFLAIPLRSDLHTAHSDSIHENKARFEMLYGREIDLLAKTIQRSVGFYEVVS